MVTLDATTLSLIGTYALVIGTIWLMYWQNRQAQKLNAANSIMTLRERFDAPHMRRGRRQLSAQLVAKTNEDITSVEVATFFELVGALTRRGVLDVDLVWEAFGTWITSYYWALRRPNDLIGRARTTLNDPLVFHEFEWLHEQIRKIDRHELGVRHAEELQSDEEARIVLQLEATLDLDDAVGARLPR